MSLMENNVLGFMMFYVQNKDLKSYKYNLDKLKQEDVEKIYKINNTFLAHRDRLLYSLFQGVEKLNEYTFGNINFRLCIKCDGVYEVGYWGCWVSSSQDDLRDNSIIASGSYCVGSELVSLVAQYYGYTFIEAIDLIYGHIASNETLYPHVIKGKGGYKEELFPIIKKFNFVKNNNIFIQ